MEEDYTEDRCKWIKDKSGNRYFIPGCMGGAAHGHDGCTCEESRVFQIDSIVGEMREFRSKIYDLQSRVMRLESENRRLKEAIKPRIIK